MAKAKGFVFLVALQELETTDERTPREKDSPHNGHSTLDMPRRYVHLARRNVAEQHKKFSPMEWLSKDSRVPDAHSLLRSCATPLSAAMKQVGSQWA